MQASRDRIDCFRCRHFKVTHDPKAPRACLAYGFKGQDIPSRTVQRESGQPCKAYEARERRR